jgi:hypothetical protein
MEDLIKLKRNKLNTLDFLQFLKDELDKIKKIIYKQREDYMQLGLLYKDLDMIDKYLKDLSFKK